MDWQGVKILFSSVHSFWIGERDMLFNDVTNPWVRNVSDQSIDEPDVSS
jgi:hypothetical protein